MPLASSTLELGQVVAKTKPRTVGLKKTAKFGAKVQAKKPGFLSRVGAGFKKVASKTMGFAKKAGIPLPLQKDVAALQTKKKDLRGLMFQCDDVQSKFLPKLLKLKTGTADALHQTAQKAIKQGRAQAQSAIKLLDDAILAGDDARKRIEKGEIPATAMAVFGTKQMVANNVYNQARLRLKQVLQVRDQAVKMMADKQTVAQTVRSYAGAVGQTVSEAGSFAARTAQDVGEGVMAAAPAARYLPAIAIGLGVVYLISVAPKSSKE